MRLFRPIRLSVLRPRLLAVLAVLCGVGAQAQESFDAAGLVPAAFGIWTDRAGSSWSVETTGNIGRIGSTMVNSGLALLVDEEKFASHRPMMTADGKELVLQGLPLDPLPGLQVQRRVRLLDEPGGLRYAELFHNGSADPMTLSVGLATNFSGNFKTFLSDRGRSEPLLLGPSESGVVVLPGASQSSRAFLFTLAGTAGGERPTVSSQNRYGLTFRYRLDLAPGETGVIVHHVAQVAIPQTFDRGTLQRLGAPYALDRLHAAFDSDWRPYVANVRESADLSPQVAMERLGLASLGIVPGTSDILAIGEETRLVGKAEGDRIVLSSAFGEMEIPLDQIAAIAGGKRRGDGRVRVYLRDGQILSGTAKAEGLGFVPVNGARIAFDPTAHDRLVFAGAPAADVWPAGVDALVETHDGDLVRAEATTAPLLNLATPWGSLPVLLKDLVWLHPLPGDAPGYRVELQDGTRCEGYPDAETVSFVAVGFGEKALPVSHLKRVFTRSAWARRGDGGAPVAGAAIRLAGDQTLQGQIGDETLSILSEGTALETPLAEIRRIERFADASSPPRFRVERWDGGTLVGSLPLDFLSVKVAGRDWRIPPRDLAGVEFAPPALTVEMTARIEALVANLASPDWATREKATRELGAFGYLARPVLRRELGAATDPEVERRLERILSIPQ